MAHGEDGYVRAGVRAAGAFEIARACGEESDGEYGACGSFLTIWGDEFF